VRGARPRPAHAPARPPPAPLPTPRRAPRPAPQAEDTLMTYESGDGAPFKLVCDPKSLLYLFGMRLDYSDALIGGGFQFHNPNAENSCGCGKSFGV